MVKETLLKPNIDNHEWFNVFFFSILGFWSIYGNYHFFIGNLENEIVSNSMNHLIVMLMIYMILDTFYLIFFIYGFNINQIKWFIIFHHLISIIEGYINLKYGLTPTIFTSIIELNTFFRDFRKLFNKYNRNGYKLYYIFNILFQSTFVPITFILVYYLTISSIIFDIKYYKGIPSIIDALISFAGIILRSMWCKEWCNKQLNW